jgi:large subunit ribosomal protein L24
MKLKRDDKVVVILGKDKGKTGTVLGVLPKENKVLVENINVIKRHTKPSKKQPRGGILEIAKPIAVSKVMVLDPASGKPARVGYEIKPDGTKERIFKVSANQHSKSKKADKPKTTEKADKSESAPKAETKAGKKK